MIFSCFHCAAAWSFAPVHRKLHATRTPCSFDIFTRVFTTSYMYRQALLTLNVFVFSSIRFVSPCLRYSLAACTEYEAFKGSRFARLVAGISALNSSLSRFSNVNHKRMYCIHVGSRKLGRTRSFGVCLLSHYKT